MIKWQLFGKQRKTISIFAKYLFYRTQDAMILRGAAALSYTTLLAVVPLLSVLISVFAAFPIFDSVRQQVEEFLIQYLMPDVIQNVQIYIGRFISAVKQLTAVGIIGIAITAVLMLSTIENSYNFIFQVKKPRRLSVKLLIYSLLLILGPVLIGILFMLRGYLFTLKYFQPENLFGYNVMATMILPRLLTFGCLWLSYIAVPNKKINFRNAFWGTAAAYIAMLILRFGFGYFLALNVTYRTIYGALAAVPLLLVWMYLWWTVVLSGAILTAALEEFRHKKKLWSSQTGSQKN